MIKPSAYNPIIHKQNINFGSSLAIDDSSLADKRRARMFEDLAERASDVPPSTTKSFVIVTSLMSASALTGAVVSGRFFDFLNGIGALKKITPKVPKAIDFMKKQIVLVDAKNASKFKKVIVDSSKALLNSLDDLSKVGVEEGLMKLNSKKANRINKIGQKIKKMNPELKYSKDELRKAVDEYISITPKEREYFDKFPEMIDDLKGTNLSRKVTKSAAATVMGVGALKEASKDLDNNGVPDCVEFGAARKESTQKLTAALLDCAIDSISA